MSLPSSLSVPALLSHGFRTFFLAAILFGVAVLPYWIAVWQGRSALGGPFDPLDWHVHEMVFGYAGSVIAGFLFTAVPNWTGRMPVRGWPLLALVLLWLCGRLVMAGFPQLPPFWAMVVDCAFLASIAAMILVEIVAGRNWRNLMVMAPVLILLCANLVFHAEVMAKGTSDYGRRLGISAVILLITLIGGRIIPSFTRNWLVRQGRPERPTPFSRFDVLCLAVGALALGVWSVLPASSATVTAMAVAGALHFVRLARWRGLSTWRSPLLAMLHVAYLLVPLGMVTVALGTSGWVSPAAGVHLLGIGAIGGMTVAVMIRATRGHTGRSLDAGTMLTAGFVLIVAAAPVRAFLGTGALTGLDGVTLAAGLWTVGFALIALRMTPWLVAANADRRQPSGRTA